MTIVARVASLIFNTPLLVLPETAATIASALSDRFAVAPMEEIDASRFVGRPVETRLGNGETRDAYRIEDGVALIGVMGELVNRGAWIGASSGLSSYEGLDAQLRAAAEDSRVRAIVLDMNSPGGSAAGAMETASLVRQVTAKKPVVAFVNSMAASAAYAIASGATRIITTPSGVLGSIGVVWMHVDRSEQIAKAGLKPTILQAGAFKTDGHSMAALAPDAQARIQNQINAIYELFVSTVAAHRPITAEAIKKTEAGVFMGQQAVDAGLADAVGTLDDAFSYLNRDSSSASRFSPTGGSMSGNNTPAPQAEANGISLTAHNEALAAARAAAATEAGAAERGRIAAILDHAEAKGREATARKLAFSTDMGVDAAAAFLADLPKAAAPVADPAAAAPRLVPVPAVQPDGEAAAAAPASAFEAGALEAKRLLGIK